MNLVMLQWRVDMQPYTTTSIKIPDTAYLATREMYEALMAMDYLFSNPKSTMVDFDRAYIKVKDALYKAQGKPIG